MSKRVSNRFFIRQYFSRSIFHSTKSYFFSLILLLLLSVLTGCHFNTNPSPSDSILEKEFLVNNIVFDSTPEKIDIWRIMPVGQTFFPCHIGWAIVEEDAFIYLEIEYPAYPWEQQGTVTEYQNHIWKHWENLYQLVITEDYSIEGFITYHTTYFAVLNQGDILSVYALSEGSTINNMEFSHFLLFLEEQLTKDYNLSGIS